MIGNKKVHTFVLVLFSLLGCAFSYADLGPVVKVGAGRLVWMEAESDGTIHVVYNGKYRSGPSIDKLGEEEQFVESEPGEFMNPKIDVDPRGVPHVVYQKGRTKNASSCYYVTKEGGEWSAPEGFAYLEDLSADAKRTMLPDVCADAEGNVLACFWASRNTGELKKAVYRWRTSDGEWGPYLGDLSGYHAASPKVERTEQGFYLHYAKSDFDKILSGPVAFGERFGEHEIDFKSRSIERSFQNEGTNFWIDDSGRVIASGNFRKHKDGGGVGIWVSDNRSGAFEARIIANRTGDRRGKGEGHLQPDIAVDEETGDTYLTFFDDTEKKAYGMVERAGQWSEPFRLYPEGEGTQGYFRCGPSVADVPGRGVVACFVDDESVFVRSVSF